VHVLIDWHTMTWVTNWSVYSPIVPHNGWTSDLEVISRIVAATSQLIGSTFLYSAQQNVWTVGSINVSIGYHSTFESFHHTCKNFPLMILFWLNWFPSKILIELTFERTRVHKQRGWRAVSNESFIKFRTQTLTYKTIYLFHSIGIPTGDNRSKCHSFRRRNSTASQRFSIRSCVFINYNYSLSKFRWNILITASTYFTERFRNITTRVCRLMLFTEARGVWSYDR